MSSTPSESTQSLEKRVQKLRAFFNKNRRLPSYSEMAGLFDVRSKNAVSQIVDKLIDAGIVSKDRTGRLIPLKLISAVKVLGTVEAGWPSPAEEELVDTISLDDFLVEKKDSSFLLKVSGESMIDAGIHPGDYVIVERGRTPRTGDIVVASVDEEWTIKRFQKRGNTVTLLPANAKFKPIQAEHALTVAGVVKAVIRKYK